MGIARYVNLSFVVLGLILYAVLGAFFSFVIELFGSSVNFAILGNNFRLAHAVSMIVSVGIALYLYRNQKVYDYTTEVAQELSKVTWPTWEDTKKSTIVVIVTTLIISSLLGLFDWVWGALSSLYYS